VTAGLTDADLAAIEERAALTYAAGTCGCIDDATTLLAELRRLRGLLRDYAVACDVIDATLGIEAPETWEAAQAAHEAARDALYTEGKR
jgi:hypothetical protein